jgi:hypothetical protein
MIHPRCPTCPSSFLYNSAKSTYTYTLKPCLDFASAIFRFIGSLFSRNRTPEQFNNADWVIAKLQVELSRSASSNPSFNTLYCIGNDLKNNYDFWKRVLTINSGAAKAIPKSAWTEEFVIRLISDHKLFARRTILGYDSYNFGFREIILKTPSHFLNNERVISALAETRRYDLLNFMSERLRSNKEFAKRVILSHPLAIKCFSDEIRDDDEVVQLASAKCRWSPLFASARHRGHLLGFLPEYRFKAVEWKSPKISKCMLALNFPVYVSFNPCNRSNFNTYIRAVRMQTRTWEISCLNWIFSASDTLLKQKTFWVEAMLQNRLMEHRIPKSIKNDPSVQLISGILGNAFEFHHSPYREAEDLTLPLEGSTFIARRGLTYQHCSICDDTELMLYVIHNNPELASYLSPRLKNDVEFAKKVYQLQDYDLSSFTPAVQAQIRHLTAAPAPAA